jgi:hypothetical protein
MWFLTTVVKGNRHFENDSPIGNRVLISDTTEMVISGRSSHHDGYRFEARIGNESFIVSDFLGAQPQGTLAAKFLAMAKQMGAMVAAVEA